MTAEADRMARARQEFTEAMARGCSIPELRRIKARERQIESEARLEARRNCGRQVTEAPRRSPFLQAAAASPDEPRNEPWMMRD